MIKVQYHVAQEHHNYTITQLERSNILLQTEKENGRNQSNNKMMMMVMMK